MVSKAWLFDVLDELERELGLNPVKVVMSQRRTEAGRMMWKSTFAMIWMIWGVYMLRVRMGFHEEVGKKPQHLILVSVTKN